METRLRLYNKQETKNSISLPPDTPSYKRTIRWSKKEVAVDGYEAVLENTEKILPSAPKKSRKSKQIYVISNKKPEIQVNQVKLPITLC